MITRDGFSPEQSFPTNSFDQEFLLAVELADYQGVNGYRRDPLWVARQLLLGDPRDFHGMSFPDVADYLGDPETRSLPAFIIGASALDRPVGPGSLALRAFAPFVDAAADLLADSVNRRIVTKAPVLAAANRAISDAFGQSRYRVGTAAPLLWALAIERAVAASGAPPYVETALSKRFVGSWIRWRNQVYPPNMFPDPVPEGYPRSVIRLAQGLQHQDPTIHSLALGEYLDARAEAYRQRQAAA